MDKVTAILAVIVALDHALSYIKAINANSTFQLITGCIAAIYNKLTGGK